MARCERRGLRGPGQRLSLLLPMGTCRSSVVTNTIHVLY